MIDIERVISVKELKELLKRANNCDLVCIRHCVGTDFPPFITIETPIEHIKANSEPNGFECLSME